MKEKGICFSGPMVRAILNEENPKTQTRRPIKPPLITRIPQYDEPSQTWLTLGIVGVPTKCPYEVGQILWVKETLVDDGINYDPSMTLRAYYSADFPGQEWASKLRPSVHMPRWMSRLSLRVTAVRPERLRDITEADAIAEGALEWAREEKEKWEYAYPMAYCAATGPNAARTAFAQLWDSVYAKKGFPFESNPGVWVVAFERM